MKDRCHREIDYLRVSVTDRCNLRCVYCMPEAGVPWLPHADLLSYEELLRLCRIFAGLGVKRVKLTGGEPLVRRGLPFLLASLKAIDGIEAVTLTTNGVLLAAQLPDLLAAGLDGVNISLDTLDPVQFASLTRGEGLDRVLAGLDAALAAPGLTVKLNCVPLGRNDDQLLPLALLARDRRLAVRFIELMPIGPGKGLEPRSEAQVRRLLEARLGPLLPREAPLGGGPCRYFSVPGFQGKLGFISAISHPFCSRCNRLRLTSTGFLKSCLQYESGVPLKPLLSGADGGIRAAILEAVSQKPSAHRFQAPEIDGEETRTMSQIGG
ncbi:MAG: GTP 3',8-cyclase MoaA [Clostridiales bacterium]|nr:GTP 3',8-cyclase MoaA [Clostridiales bacterium]